MLRIYDQILPLNAVAFSLAFDAAGEKRPALKLFAAKSFPYILILYLVGLVIDRKFESGRRRFVAMVSNGVQLAREGRGILRSGLDQLIRRFNGLVLRNSEVQVDDAQRNQNLAP
jgi:hypothetical protein